MEKAGIWMSILEYATYKKTSISTIRRSIKANRIKNERRQGKYYIYVHSENLNNRDHLEKKELQLMLENKRLKDLLVIKNEELNDLSMLIEIYEGKKSKARSLPELPVV